MPNPSRRHLLRGMAAFALAPAAAVAEPISNAREAFDVAHVELFLASLDPAHDGLKVAQLSDLHIGHGVPDGRIIRAVRAVNDAKPDVVVMTGDYVTTRSDPVSRVKELLSPLAAPSFAVLGNHDHWSNERDIRLGLERMGTAVLRNTHTRTRLRGVDFSIIGVDDSTTRNDDVSAAFQGVSNGSRLVLTHTPACAGKLPAWLDVPCLSGHTHGGQWNIPGVTAGVFARAGQPWYRGHYTVRGNQLYVNRGLGFGRGTRLPRLNSEPEVTILTLRRREPV
ncbi:MAG: metallophosphoesterase [Archangium sp.]|nr:metallophosphoesterase [Archangium sp.]